MEVEDFNATYPDINDDQFQQKLLNKTEFFKIGKENIKADDIYFTFQRNLGILLSPPTPYKKMLFFLEPGVGKTCSSILVHELAKQFLNSSNLPLKPTVIITKGKSLEDNYKTDFIKTCPGIEKYFAHDEDGRIIDQLALDRQVKANFSFKKYSAFASYLAKLSDETIKELYSGRQYVLDEAQTIKNTKGATYKQYQRFFDIIEDATIILLSGTPNTDHPSEAVGLINLIKAPADRMVTGPKFLKRFYTGETFNTDKEEELLKFYNGYETYLKQTSDIETTTFIENPKFPSTFTDFKTFNLVMNKFQRDVYQKALTQTHKTIRKEKKDGLDLLKRDKEGNLLTYESKGGGTFMKLAREAATFCYPDGSFGAAGFKKNLVKVGSKIEFKDPATSQELKTNLNQYSISFSESFKIIQANPTRVFYIYFDNVNNSGLLMYAKLLELVLGFQQTDGKKTTGPPRARYVKIDGSLKTPISQILRKVGSKENADGSIVRIVLGSPLSGVGLTIPNATMVFVFDSQFTPSDITQIINRINRPGTLKYVEEAGLPTDCSAYLFASAMVNNTIDKKASTKDNSIDLDIYGIAQHKVKLIKPQTELMIRADPFCAISHNRNADTDSSKKDSPACYTASPNKKGEYKRTSKDTTTDVLYWRQEEIKTLQKEILEHIKLGPVRVSDYLDEHDPMIVYRTVKALTAHDKIVDINNSSIDETKKGPDEPETLTTTEQLTQGQKGIVYLSGDLVFIDQTASGDPNASWYIRTKTFPTQITLEDIFTKRDIEKDTEKIETMFNNKDISIWPTLSKYTRIGIWEEMWNISTPSKFQKKIKSQFPYFDIDGVPYHILYAEAYSPATTANADAIVIENPDKIRTYQDSQWQYFRGVGATIEEKRYNINELINKIKSEQKEKIQQAEEDIDPKWGVYGKYDKKGNFMLVIKSDKKRNPGRQCVFFTKQDQETILEKFGDIPEGFDDLNKNERCNLLRDTLKSHNLIVGG
uniref:Helicase C-terminal domain-containing protein n=1 Tax=viral metagenome TaxID=1070528 RepID=A0A6C0JUE2_9ZZZZ